MNNFNQALEIAQKHFPGLKIKYKNESFFMKFLSLVLFFNPEFKTKFITTIGKTIYFPSKEFIENNNTSATHILCHELVHINQSNDKFFSIKYLFPQILATFSLLAFIHPIFLIFLLFLAPIPAYFRSKYEYEAYVVSLYCKFKANENFDTLLSINSIVNNFTGSSYYYMNKNSEMLRAGFYSEMALIYENKNDLFGMKQTVDSVLGV